MAQGLTSDLQTTHVFFRFCLTADFLIHSQLYKSVFLTCAVVNKRKLL